MPHLILLLLYNIAVFDLVVTFDFTFRNDPSYQTSFSPMFITDVVPVGIIIMWHTIHVTILSKPPLPTHPFSWIITDYLAYIDLSRQETSLRAILPVEPHLALLAVWKREPLLTASFKTLTWTTDVVIFWKTRRRTPLPIPSHHTFPSS